VVEVKSDEAISAKPVEEVVFEDDPIQLVKTVFQPTDKGWDILDNIPDDVDVVIGSIIAAQAYIGHIVRMTPAVGFERVPVAEKRMRPDKFTVFGR